MTKSVIAQKQNNLSVIYFENASDTLDHNLLSNQTTIDQLDSILKRISNSKNLKINRIVITGNSSPEGSPKANKNLSKSRAQTLKKHIIDNYKLSENRFLITSSDDNWQKLKTYIQNISNLLHKDQIIFIIDSIPLETWRRINPNDKYLTLTESRMKHLMDLNGGKSYRYLTKSVFPYLRNANIDIQYSINNKPQEIISCKPLNSSIPIVIMQPITIGEPRTNSCTAISGESKPLFALKTNLLFDALTLLNFEIEIPIKQHWSIAAELIFPWWSFNNGQADSKRNRIQLLNANLEARYWWNKEPNRPILTGWFSGIYGGGGLYDFERHAKGYQGEFFIAFGLSGGYAHTINKSKSLRMEYSLGVGYLGTNYRYYEAHYCVNNQWHAVKQHTGRYTWFGPTKAKVSLSWLINYKKRKFLTNSYSQY